MFILVTFFITCVDVGSYNYQVQLDNDEKAAQVIEQIQEVGNNCKVYDKTIDEVFKRIENIPYIPSNK